MFENEANNNNTSSVTQSTEVMLEGVSDNKNCLQSLMTEEDSANGNVPLPVWIFSRNQNLGCGFAAHREPSGRGRFLAAC